MWGEVRCGHVWQLRQVKARRCTARIGAVRQERRGMVLLGPVSRSKVRYGTADMVRLGKVRLGDVGFGRSGTAGKAR